MAHGEAVGFSYACRTNASRPFLRLLLAAAICAYMPAISSAYETDDEHIKVCIGESSEQALVRILSKDNKSLGTGFLLNAKGTVLTNYHVIQGRTAAKVMMLDKKIFGIDQVLMPGDSLIDKPADTALLRIKAGENELKKYGYLLLSEEDVKRNHGVFAMSFPKGEGRRASSDDVKPVKNIRLRSHLDNIGADEDTSKLEYPVYIVDDTYLCGSSGAPVFEWPGGKVIGTLTGPTKRKSSCDANERYHAFVTPINHAIALAKKNALKIPQQPAPGLNSQCSEKLKYYRSIKQRLTIGGQIVNKMGRAIEGARVRVSLAPDSQVPVQVYPKEELTEENGYFQLQFPFFEHARWEINVTHPFYYLENSPLTYSTEQINKHHPEDLVELKLKKRYWEQATIFYADRYTLGLNQNDSSAVNKLRAAIVDGVKVKNHKIGFQWRLCNEGPDCSGFDKPGWLGLTPIEGTYDPSKRLVDNEVELSLPNDNKLISGKKKFRFKGIINNDVKYADMQVLANQGKEFLMSGSVVASGGGVPHDPNGYGIILVAYGLDREKKKCVRLDRSDMNDVDGFFTVRMASGYNGYVLSVESKLFNAVEENQLKDVLPGQWKQWQCPGKGLYIAKDNVNWHTNIEVYPNIN